FTQDYEDQAYHNLFTEWNACFTHNQTNNVGITQHYEESINALQQQYNTKSVKENENPNSLVSRHTRRHSYKECKKCNRMKAAYDKISDQCRSCYGASLRVFSGNKLIDDFIELTQTCHGRNYNVVLKCLNNSEKMDSDCLYE
ncbi:15762_t:CDS:2, partial [Gigaspora margarita]